MARADARSMKVGPAPVASGDAAEKGKTVGKPAASYKSSRRRRNLSVAEASLSAHSLRLRRALRDLPGLSVNERRALLERWGDLTSRERLKMVDTTMCWRAKFHNLNYKRFKPVPAFYFC